MPAAAHAAHGQGDASPAPMVLGRTCAVRHKRQGCAAALQTPGRRDAGVQVPSMMNRRRLVVAGSKGEAGVRDAAHELSVRQHAGRAELTASCPFGRVGRLCATSWCSLAVHRATAVWIVTCYARSGWFPQMTPMITVKSPGHEAPKGSCWSGYAGPGFCGDYHQYPVGPHPRKGVAKSCETIVLPRTALATTSMILQCI
jgi:hypothetical protein